MFDREGIEVYRVPIEIYGQNDQDPRTYNVTIFIDDVDDLPSEYGPIRAIIYTPTSTFTGRISQLHPSDEDVVDTGICYSDRSNINVRSWIMFSTRF